MVKPEVIRKNFYLNVYRDPEDPSKYMGDGNTFVVRGVTDDNLHDLACALIGYRGEINLTVKTGTEGIYALPKSDKLRKSTERKDRDIYNELAYILTVNGNHQSYATPHCEAIENWYSNIVNVMRSGIPIYQLDMAMQLLEGKPVIFCGGGPSMSDYREDIERIIANEQAVVIAGGTGIKILHDWGLHPHLCIAADPFAPEWDNVFSQLDREWVSGKILVTLASLHTKCFEEWRLAGGFIVPVMYMDPFPICQYLTECREINIGQTVSTFAMELCEQYGAESLSLLGLDLAYKRKMGGLIEHATGGRSSKEEIEVGDVTTRPAWLIERQYMVVQLQHYKNCKFTRIVPDDYPVLPIDGLRTSNELVIEDKKVELNITLHPEKLTNISENAIILLKSLEEFDIKDPDTDSLIYKYLFKRYDQLQGSNYMRGGDYSYYLMEAVKDFNRFYLQVIGAYKVSTDVKATGSTHPDPGTVPGRSTN